LGASPRWSGLASKKLPQPTFDEQIFQADGRRERA
jgi:hypothetical protein